MILTLRMVQSQSAIRLRLLLVVLSLMKRCLRSVVSSTRLLPRSLCVMSSQMSSSTVVFHVQPTSLMMLRTLVTIRHSVLVFHSTLVMCWFHKRRQRSSRRARKKLMQSLTIMRMVGLPTMSDITRWSMYGRLSTKSSLMSL